MTTVLKQVVHQDEPAASPAIVPSSADSDAATKAAKQQAIRLAEQRAVTEAIQAHFHYIRMEAALPGIRDDMLQALLPLEISQKIKQAYRTDWSLGDPIPPNLSPQAIIRTAQTVRTLHPMMAFEFLATAQPEDLIEIQVRLQGRYASFTTTAARFSALEAPLNEWTSFFGTNKKSRAPRPR